MVALRSPVDLRHKAGFTLIELSIVLVIIGLIVGGVLVGQDLINMAAARKVMSKLDAYDTAVSTFRTKYNCVPGDCPNATNFGLGANGDGNGGIDGLFDPGTGDSLTFSPGTHTDGSNCGGACVIVCCPTAETNGFWTHLGNAGLIGGTGTIPGGSLTGVNDPLGNTWMLVFTWNSKTYFRTGITTNSVYSGAGALSGGQMQYISGKLGETILIDPGYASCNGNWCGYPPSLSQGQKAVPLGLAHPLSQPAIYVPPVVSANGGTPCVNVIGGMFTFNTNAAGNCNLMWKLDGM